MGNDLEPILTGFDQLKADDGMDEVEDPKGFWEMLWIVT